MAKTFLNGLSKAALVERGYAQVEPNHLSAQRTGQIYAQLPAAADIDVLENGQFVKYDYAKGVVNFSGEGEWMLVYNEIKLYRDGQDDCEFAMVKGNYNARIYAASTGELTDDARSRDYRDIVVPADPYEFDSTIDPFHIYNKNEFAKMPEGTKMVPRVLKTNVGDIMTTNCIAKADVALEDKLAPNAQGILDVAGDDAAMLWQVVKVYTMPDGQKGAKIMRIK